MLCVEWLVAVCFSILLTFAFPCVALIAQVFGSYLNWLLLLGIPLVFGYFSAWNANVMFWLSLGCLVSLASGAS